MSVLFRRKEEERGVDEIAADDSVTAASDSPTAAAESRTAADEDSDAAVHERLAEIRQTADDVRTRVAGVLASAEETAERTLAAAREEAAAIRRQARSDAEAHVQQMLSEAEHARSEADEYVANVRVAVEAYASARQAEAEEEARKKLDEAEAEATRIRAAAPPEAAVVAAAPTELALRRRRASRVRGHVELTAITAVMSRDVAVFRHSWVSTTFSAIVEPIIFLLAFGFGIGHLINRVEGVDYIPFVGTGVVASTIVAGSAFPGMFSTFVKSRFQKVYDALLATPVNVNELVTAEVLWIAIRAGVYSLAPVGVAMAFGLTPVWGIALVPAIAFVAGFGLAAFGVAVSSFMKSINNFSYVVSGLVIPLLLLAGTFFPINDLPEGAFLAAQFNPLYHVVQLVRHVGLFGIEPAADLVHAGVLVFFALLMWRIAIWRMRPRLID